MFTLIDRYTGKIDARRFKTSAEAENARKGFRCYVAQSVRGEWVSLL